MKIEKGDLVKVSRKNERIWIFVTSINENIITGTIDSYPINKQIGKYGDVIQCLAEEVDRKYLEKEF